MQMTEVTQDQWQAVMGANPSVDPSYFKGLDIQWGRLSDITNCGGNCPVVKLDREDIMLKVRFFMNLPNGRP